MPPNSQQMSELVQRIVSVAHPLRVILFGSAARGEMKEESDLDILVVVSEGTHCRQVARTLHMHLFGIPFGVDLIVTTPSILERHREHIGLVYRTILKEGKELYAA
ncbi:MAG TPA: nucleotidyltransferase domain-containing protein [Terriglobia bacterium]|nr:nucleotidyltransferase domain-containing protein [Terriglobia bacterium]